MAKPKFKHTFFWKKNQRNARLERTRVGAAVQAETVVVVTVVVVVVMLVVVVVVVVVVAVAVVVVVIDTPPLPCRLRSE